MKLSRNGTKLTVSGVRELGVANRTAFLRAVDGALDGDIAELTIDLSETEFLDCKGVGALLAVRKAFLRRAPGCAFKLADPSPSVRRLLQVAQLTPMLEPVRDGFAQQNKTGSKPAVCSSDSIDRMR